MATSAFIPAGLPPNDSVMPMPTATAALITAGLPPDDEHSGYRLYVGEGGVGAVDFSEPVAAVLKDESSIVLAGYGFAASSRYTAVLRARLEKIENPDVACRTAFETDADLEWVGTQPDRVTGASAEIKAGGVIRLMWDYAFPAVAPDDFAIWYGTDPDTLGTGDPDYTVNYASPGRRFKSFTLDDATAYYFRIVARKSDVESQAITVGPYVADATAPDKPTLTTSTHF